MTKTRLTRVLAAIFAAGILASCAGESVLDAAEERERRGAARERTAPQEKARGDKAVKQSANEITKADVQQESRSQGTRTAPSSSTKQGSTAEKSEVVAEAPPSKAPSEPAEACATDMSRDMETSGGAPSYADLTRGCIREDGSQLSLEAATVAALPARMPDQNTHLAIGFALERPTGQTVYVTAEATDDGWNAYYSQGQGRQELPAPSISGSRLQLSVPASALDGAQRVTWRVESSWLRSTLTSTSYAFDDAPNGSTATFGRG